MRRYPALPFQNGSRYKLVLNHLPIEDLIHPWFKCASMPFTSICIPFRDLLRFKCQKHDDGYSIVLVLWFLVLLSLLGANLVREARATYDTSGTSLARLQAQAAADGGVNFAIQNLFGPLGSTLLSSNGEFINIRLLDKDIAIKVEDEAGKIDLITANFPLLSALMRGVEVASPEADYIAQNAVAWRLPQSTATEDNSDRPYLEAGRLYGPRYGPFRAVSELRLVLGMTDSIQAAVAPYTTVWSDHAGIDRGAASDAVLGVLAAAGDGLAVSEIRKRRSGADGGASRKVVLSHTFSIVARATSADVIAERHAVVKLVPGKRKPYVVLDWS